MTLIHLACGDSLSVVGKAGTSAVANQSSSSTPAAKSKLKQSSAQEESQPVKRQRLQEQQKRNKVVEETLITVIKDSTVTGGNTYQCHKCKKVLRIPRLRAIAHADKCGKRSCKKRGKSLRKFPCSLCGHKETTKAAMTIHRLSAHQITVRKIQCSATQCMRYYSSVSALR